MSDSAIGFGDYTRPCVPGTTKHPWDFLPPTIQSPDGTEYTLNELITPFGKELMRSWFFALRTDPTITFPTSKDRLEYYQLLSWVCKTIHDHERFIAHRAMTSVQQVRKRNLRVSAGSKSTRKKLSPDAEEFHPHLSADVAEFRPRMEQRKKQPETDLQDQCLQEDKKLCEQEEWEEWFSCASEDEKRQYEDEGVWHLSEEHARPLREMQDQRFREDPIRWEEPPSKDWWCDRLREMHEQCSDVRHPRLREMRKQRLQEAEKHRKTDDEEKQGKIVEFDQLLCELSGQKVLSWEHIDEKTCIRSEDVEHIDNDPEEAEWGQVAEGDATDKLEFEWWAGERVIDQAVAEWLAAGGDE